MLIAGGQSATRLLCTTSILAGASTCLRCTSRDIAVDFERGMFSDIVCKVGSKKENHRLYTGAYPDALKIVAAAFCFATQSCRGQ